MSSLTAGGALGDAEAAVTGSQMPAALPAIAQEQQREQLSILRIKRKRTQQPTPLDALGQYAAC